MPTEVRLAFALNGGVSLAIWIGGVADEVLRCINGGRDASEGQASSNPYAAVCAELGLVLKADVLTGTSAGGLNAACLATAVSHGCEDLAPIRSLWLAHGSFDRLMRTRSDTEFVSLLAGDDNFLPHIEEALRGLAGAGTGYRRPDPPVVVRLTGTSLVGHTSTLRDRGGTLSSLDHRAEFVFRSEDFDFDEDPRAVARIARACRSSASFPGAFEPSYVESGLFEARHTWGLFEDGETTVTPVIDGGVLVNLPAQAALDAIIRQPSRERVERVLALVVPDPGGVMMSQRFANRTLGQVMTKALVGIPLTQSLTDFVGVLKEHNREVRSRRSARDAMLAELGAADAILAWSRWVTLGESLFPAYRAMRLASSLDPSRLTERPGPGAAPEELALGRGLVGTDHAPWVPEVLSIGGDQWCWGSGAVRRLASILITWVNTVADVAAPELTAPLLEIKETASRVREEADHLAPVSGTLPRLLAEELVGQNAALRSAVQAAFERACARWPGGEVAPAKAIQRLNGTLVEIADALGRFVELARQPAAQWAEDIDGRSLRGLVRLADGCVDQPDGLLRLLLCMEVVEVAFAGADPRPDQEVRLVQFTSAGRVDIDPSGRSGTQDKLAGIELAHFGAFLKGSWRANDWLWGRLDAAQRLLQLLDASAGDRLSISGTLEQHTRAVQAAVLREELPVLVAQIEHDARLGANVTQEARAFVDAVRRIGTSGDDPDVDVNLAAATEEQLAELLRLQVVGAEEISQEAGSDLATLTSIGALRASLMVLHAQGPRMLRGPAGVLGASSSLAWRLARRGWGAHLGGALVVLVIVTGLIGLVGSFLGLGTDVSLGPFRYGVIACLLLTPLLAVIAAPWFFVTVGRRKVTRAR